MHFIPYQTFGRERKQGELDGRCKTSRIGDVVCLDNLVPGAFAQPVDEMPACMVSIQPEVVAEIDYPAVGADIVGIDELSRNAV